MAFARFATLVLVLLFAFIPHATHAAAGIAAHDPLVAVDLNRDVIVADIVERFRRDAGDAGTVADLRSQLAKLRADRLLAASVASSYASLQAILVEAAAARHADLARSMEKNFGDPSRDLLYTPLSPCRLIDTRGFGAPITGGAYTPNTRRSYVPNGLCGIPTSGVTAMLVSFTTENLTPNSGGYIAMVAPAAPILATVDVFNLASEWSASSTTVPTGSGGQFDVFVSTANAHVVIDVVGYFAAPSGGAVGTLQIADGAVTAAKLGASGCVNGQVLRYNGTAWVCTSLTVATLACNAGDVISCYTGTANTAGVGACKPGFKVCDNSGNYGACTGQIVPAAEVADGIDNNCNGQVDEGFPVATVVTPDAVAHQILPIRYSVSDAASAAASVAIQFSTDGGSTWNTATRSGTSGEATTGLATSPAGTPHVFFWQTFTDGVGLSGALPTVRVRVTPTTSAAGLPASTAAFAVDNNFQRKVASVTSGVLARDGIIERKVETPLGDLLADALRAQAGTQLFVVNGGGIRSPLPSFFTPANTALRRPQGGFAAGPPYDLVMGDAYSEFPFGNYTVTATITGAQVWQMLEESVSLYPNANGGFFQISGFTFGFSASAPAGSRVQGVAFGPGPTPIFADGTTYTIGMSDFNGAGGDNHPVLAGLVKSTSYKIWADVLLDYLVNQGTIDTPPGGRIVQSP
jgi:hypothetical protein